MQRRCWGRLDSPDLCQKRSYSCSPPSRHSFCNRSGSRPTGSRISLCPGARTITVGLAAMALAEERPFPHDHRVPHWASGAERQAKAPVNSVL
jgi:hypothetical protein